MLDLRLFFGKNGNIILFACDTFAWFTSTDEVTNRLTASADYGVSIVESFTPPELWVPGQEINKDVYAVNTGNIDAYVEEDVSGILNITYRNFVGKFGVAGINYVELDGDQITAKEAGGYLIWNNAGAANGPINSKRDGDMAEGETKWTPTANGDYLFRRYIESEDKFTIEGCHYEDGKYYLIYLNKKLKFVLGTTIWLRRIAIKFRRITILF